MKANSKNGDKRKTTERECQGCKRKRVHGTLLTLPGDM